MLLWPRAICHHSYKVTSQQINNKEPYLLLHLLTVWQITGNIFIRLFIWRRLLQLQNLCNVSSAHSSGPFYQQIVLELYNPQNRTTGKCFKVNLEWFKVSTFKRNQPKSWQWKQKQWKPKKVGVRPKFAQKCKPLTAVLITNRCP